MSGAMIDVLLDQEWRGNAYRQVVSGDGVVSESAGILTTSTALGLAAQQKFFWLPIMPGQIVEVTVLARAITAGVLGPELRLELCDHDEGNRVIVERVAISTDDWRSYQATYT